MPEQLAGGQPIVEGQVTGHVADPPTDGDAVAPSVETEELDRAGVRADEVEEEPDGRRLAGTAW
ncbi:MAG: hypothetical protein M0029_10875 [Actinomycetota bacterium]|nr:hypothetical protein [Actinomycetota bacterium]